MLHDGPALLRDGPVLLRDGPAPLIRRLTFSPIVPESRSVGKLTSDIIRGMKATDTPQLPDAETAMAMLRGAIGQIEFARQYSLELLDATPKEDWFKIPDGLPTNIAWQVGHITVSQYGLLLFRIRGRLPEDLSLIPGKFRKAYSRESTPSSDPSSQPSAEELLARMKEVYDLSLSELASVSPSVLLEPVDMPYAAYPIKLGAILFCPLHEHIHAGQIGLVRRAFGLPSVR